VKRRRHRPGAEDHVGAVRQCGLVQAENFPQEALETISGHSVAKSTRNRQPQTRRTLGSTIAFHPKNKAGLGTAPAFTDDERKIPLAMQPFVPAKPLVHGVYFGVNDQRPFLRRALKTRRPPGRRIFRRNPWTLARCRTFG